MAGITCPKCGSCLDAEARYCPNCGIVLYEDNDTDVKDLEENEGETAESEETVLRTRRVIESSQELYDSSWQILADIATIAGVVFVLFLLLRKIPIAAGIVFVGSCIGAGYLWKRAADERGVSFTLAAILGNKIIPYERTPEYRFANDPVYRERVIKQVHLKADTEHKVRIARAERNRQALISRRSSEIRRVEESRWVLEYSIRYNMNEGILLLNGVKYRFAEIRGARVETESGQRYEEDGEEHTESRRHVSVGGAVVGGVLFGAAGAVAGGLLMGKNTTDSEHHVQTRSIPTCEQIYVVVNINGFEVRIPFLTEPVDKGSDDFVEAMHEANLAIQVVHKLAAAPAPLCLKAEEDSAVLAIDAQIQNAEMEIDRIREEPVQYVIPKKYTGE